VIGDYSFAEPLAIGQRLVFETCLLLHGQTTTFNGVRLPSIAIWNSASGAVRVVREFGYETSRDDCLERAFDQVPRYRIADLPPEQARFHVCGALREDRVLWPRHRARPRRDHRRVGQLERFDGTSDPGAEGIYTWLPSTARRGRARHRRYRDGC